MWSRMPAPSLVHGSHPAAPRWARRRKISTPFVTTSWVGGRRRSATKPSPQASRSSDGSYMPRAGGRPIVGSSVQKVDATRQLVRATDLPAQTRKAKVSFEDSPVASSLLLSSRLPSSPLVSPRSANAIHRPDAPNAPPIGLCGRRDRSPRSGSRAPSGRRIELLLAWNLGGARAGDRRDIGLGHGRHASRRPPSLSAFGHGGTRGADRPPGERPDRAPRSRRAGEPRRPRA